MTDTVEIGFSRTADLVGQGALILVGVGVAFSHSLSLGLLVCVAALLIGSFLVPRHRASQEKRGAAMVLGEAGIDIRFGYFQGTVVPWFEIESIGLQRGRAYRLLGIRVKHPEKFLGRFMRINMWFARYQILLPTSRLDCSAKDLITKIETFRKANA